MDLDGEDYFFSGVAIMGGMGGNGEDRAARDKRQDGQSDVKDLETDIDLLALLKQANNAIDLCLRPGFAANRLSPPFTDRQRKIIFDRVTGIRDMLESLAVRIALSTSQDDQAQHLMTSLKTNGQLHDPFEILGLCFGWIEGRLGNTLCRCPNGSDVEWSKVEAFLAAIERVRIMVPIAIKFACVVFVSSTLLL